MFFPAIVFGKIPLNGRNLVSFFSPWYWERFDGFPTGVPNKPGMLDHLRQFYPYMAFTQRMFRSEELPLWNPYNFAGNPHAGEWQSSIYYPLQILLLFLPLPVYWTFYQIVGFFMAWIFTYQYLLNLKLSSVEAMFGAATFTLSGFMSSWTMGVSVSPHTIIWLPLILLSVDKIIGKKKEEGSRKKAWWLIGLMGIVLSILAGFWQTTFYVMAISFIYFLYRLVTTKTKFISPCSLLIVILFPVAMLISSFYMLPAMELFQRGSRVIINSGESYQDFLSGYLLPLGYLVTLFAPDYFGHPTTQNYFAPISGGSYYEQVIYVGTIPLLLFLIVFLSRKWSDPETSVVKFWLLLSMVAASFAFNTPWARIIYSARIPLLSTSIPNRILFVPAFGLSILAAFGLRMVRENKNHNLVVRSVLLLGVLVTIILGVTTEKTSFRNLVIPGIVFITGSGLLLLISKTKKKFVIQSALIGLLIINSGQLIYQYHKFTPFTEKQFIFPDHSTISWLKDYAGINRFTGYNGKFLQDNLATYWGIYSTDGYDALNDRKRSLLLASSKTGKLSNSFMTSSDAILDSDLTNPKTRRLMSLLGVKYLVDHPEWLDIGPTRNLPRLSEAEQRLVFTDRDWRIWEYLEAYPRTFLVGNYEVESDDQKTLDRLYSPGFDPRTTLLLSSPISQELNIAHDPKSMVEIESYTPMKIVFKTISVSDQLLFLSDTWFPGWKAKIEDGKRLPILVAFTALRAVPVPAGNHTVTMWYFPESFRNGLIISFIMIITIILFIRIIKLNNE